jgi:hypothetical protein
LPTRKSPRLSHGKIDPSKAAEYKGVQDTSTVCVNEEDAKSRGTTPTRRSPRLARDKSDISTAAGSKGVLEKNTVFVAEPDGKSRGTAFVVSPTPSKPSAVKKVGSLCGGKTKYTAIPISPAVPESSPLNIAAKASDPSMNTSDGDGKTRSNAISVDASVNEAKSSKSTVGENMCRSIVVSPTAHSKGTTVSEEKRTWHLSPLVGAKLGRLGLVQRSPVSVSPEVKDLIRKLSESVKKQGILSRFSEKEGSSSRGSMRKRKYSESE